MQGLDHVKHHDWQSITSFKQTNKQAERLVPLDQLIEETEFPATDIALGGTKGLEVVAERKGDADLNVWKFDKDKALGWLEERVGRVAKVLQRQAIDLTQVQSSLEALICLKMAVLRSYSGSCEQ